MNDTHPGLEVLDVCGIVEEIKEYEDRSSASTATTRRPILQQKGKADSLMPPSDTKISDYYVSDVLHLDDRPRFMDAWGILILCTTILALVSFFVALFRFGTPLREASSRTSNRLFCCRRKRLDPVEDDDGIERHGILHDRARDKHKMVASVLLDMRVRESDNNSNNNWRRRIGGREMRDINESIAETDGRMTDSEVASSAPPAMSDSLSEVSSRQMMDETMSDLEDLNGSNDASIEVVSDGDLLSEREQEPPPPIRAAVIRRRRFLPNLFT